MASRRTAPRTARRRLSEYEAKRNFAVTPEPGPEAVAPTTGSSFMIHKHHASRLHYDLRLEMDEALASWAVPKGPSYDPTVKRLAVQTEDHPLAYGQFEGRIPDGEYGAGDSLVWDRGHYDTVPPGQAAAQREKGHLHLVFAGEKLRGGWHLIRTRGQRGAKSNWILLKARDSLADPERDVVADAPQSVLSGRVETRGPERRSLQRPHPAPERLLERLFPPMLATLVTAIPPPDTEWVYEVKYDGYRALAALSGGKVALWTRNRLDLGARFPRILQALGQVVVGEAVLDGEIVVLDAKGRSRFSLLQEGSDAALLFAFDLLWLDGQDLRERSLEARRDLLVSLLSNLPPRLRLAERLLGPAPDALAAVSARGLEGLVAKRRGSLYQGTRSKQWCKLKVQQSQELAVVGYTPAKGHPHQIGALLLAAAEAGQLRFAGKVGTGFSTQQRSALWRTLAPLRVAEPPVIQPPRVRGATWVRPQLVAQVRFTERTPEGKLRHPSFLGLREDKAPLEASVESPRPDVPLTHPQKVLYPRDSVTKRELADYYTKVASPLLRALAHRPLALQHWPNGIDAEGFFRQSVPVRDRQPWMQIVETPTGRGAAHHLVANSPAALAWLAQRATLTLHMWPSRADSLDQPDWVVFDLDPAPGQGISQAVRVARALLRLFEELALPSVVKTSGKRGLHVLVPLLPGHTHADALRFARQIGGAITEALPEATLERSLSKRKGRLYFDCLQNGYGKTLVAPYSPRAVDGAPVSTPLLANELDDRLDPSRFNLRSLPRRLQEVGDLFAPALTAGVRLPRLE